VLCSQLRGSKYPTKRSVLGVHPIAQTAGVLVALLAARNVVFDLAQALTGHRPPAASLLGAMLCITAAAAHATAQRHFEGLPGAQRGVLALAAVGLLLLLLQPPLPHAAQVRARRIQYPMKNFCDELTVVYHISVSVELEQGETGQEVALYWRGECTKVARGCCC